MTKKQFLSGKYSQSYHVNDKKTQNEIQMKYKYPSLIQNNKISFRRD